LQKPKNKKKKKKKKKEKKRGKLRFSYYLSYTVTAPGMMQVNWNSYVMLMNLNHHPQDFIEFKPYHFPKQFKFKIDIIIIAITLVVLKLSSIYHGSKLVWW
jgi:hypothetical protein